MAGWGVFLPRLAGLAALAVVLAEVVARAGRGPAAVLRIRRRGDLADAGISCLLGLAVLGTAYLGLGLTGLYFRWLVIAVPVLLAAASRGGGPGLVLVRAAREARSVPLAGRLVLLAAVVSSIPVLCAPELEVDCEVYHLAWPWQMLMTHRVVLDHTTALFHIPLLFDGVNGLPLALGDERVAKWLVAMSFVAASAVAAGRAFGRGRAAAAWLGPLLAFTAGTVAWMCTTAKSDMPSSACLVAGALLWLEGAWVPAAVFMGAALAGKYVYGVYVVAWLCFMPPPRGRRLPVAVALALPVLAWVAKAFLWTGNPVFPFAAAVFPTFDWGPVNDRAFLDPVKPLWLAGSESWAGLPGSWLRLMGDEYLPLLLGLPLLFSPVPGRAGEDRGTRWRTRRAAAALLVGTVLALRGGHLSRYLVPAVWLLSCLIAEEAAALPGRWRAAAVWLLAAYGLARIMVRPMFWMAQSADAFRPLGEDLAARLSTRGVIVETMHRLTPPAGPPLRVLTNGDTRSYRLPCRVVYGGALGETPLIWRIVRDSATVGDIRRRVRQLGITHLLHNFVGASWLAVRYREFAWDRRMAALYSAWCRGHLEVAAAPETVDYDNGGFYLYRVLARPRVPAPPVVFFAPGTEPLLADHYVFTDIVQDPRRACDAALAALAVLPDVLFVHNRVGHAYAGLGDLARAARELKPGVDAGMLDEISLVDYASVVTSLDRFAEAERALDEADRRCPSHGVFLRIIRANWYSRHARTYTRVRRWDAAVADIDRGLERLAGIPPGAGPQYTRTRIQIETDLLGMKGEIVLAYGDRAEGARLLRQAIALDPAGPHVARWESLVAAAGTTLLR